MYCNRNYFKIINIFVILVYLAKQAFTEQGNETTTEKGQKWPTDLNMENWTSCEEFLANTTFDTNKVVDIDWQIFYFWNYMKENTYHLKFRVPSRLLTERFKVELDKELNPPVNWSDAVLFMETSIDFSALFIRTETPGKFRLIPSPVYVGAKSELPQSASHWWFGMKYVEPGYLGVMNCKHRLCYAMAPVDRMPKPEDLKVEADRIGFYSEHGRSYLEKLDTRPSPNPISPDDADDDEELDIDEHGFQGNYIEAEGRGVDDENED